MSGQAFTMATLRTKTRMRCEYERWPSLLGFRSVRSEGSSSSKGTQQVWARETLSPRHGLAIQNLFELLRAQKHLVCCRTKAGSKAVCFQLTLVDISCISCLGASVPQHRSNVVYCMFLSEGACVSSKAAGLDEASNYSQFSHSVVLVKLSKSWDVFEQQLGVYRKIHFVLCPWTRI